MVVHCRQASFIGGIAKHPKFDFCYIGGWQGKPTKKEPLRKQVSLDSIQTGKRLTQGANICDIKFLSYNSWRLNKA